MARDRLAALRAQQGGGAANTNSDSYPMQSNLDYRSRARAANPYAQQDDNPSYESAGKDMSSTTNLTAPVGADGMAAFYNEIASIQDDIRTFNDNVARISDTHSRSLNATDDVATQRVNQQLEDLVADTSALSNVLRRRIKSLQKQGGSGRDGEIRKQQTGLVKQKFMEAIQNYQTVEQQYRQKYKQRLERQYKIVKPEASPEEVKAVVDDDQGGQIFSQALMSSNRYGEARTAYREVQERHADIKKIEKTLTELAQLFNDMSILVEQQDEQITVINDTVKEVEKDVETGLNYTSKAVDSARSARKKRWICFILCIVILIIIAIVVAVVVLQNKK
ncbi:Syntaxin-like protein psy1 [Trametes pubescens]|uniref:Syntaxin-like protein psy1 n=1 Tax=Trametes pubescens TaxID=154538 RepID=A0A1M2W4C0_TRAPU|nr:Syntaxin-like protein psy1 [Trametes pubescens]